jgi:hypothetical protein
MLRLPPGVRDRVKGHITQVRLRRREAAPNPGIGDDRERGAVFSAVANTRDLRITLPRQDAVLQFQLAAFRADVPMLLRGGSLADMDAAARLAGRGGILPTIWVLSKTLKRAEQ